MFVFKQKNTKIRRSHQHIYDLSSLNFNSSGYKIVASPCANPESLVRGVQLRQHWFF